MKPMLIAVVAVLLVLGAGVLMYVGSINRSAAPVDAVRVLSAAQEYSRRLNAQHLPVPESVSIQELLSTRLLRPDDVRGFRGLEVNVSLRGDPKNPQFVLMRAHFKDGEDLVVLADGSVQQVKAGSK